MTIHESINWFLLIWIGLFGGYCLDASQKRWFGSWSLKTALLVSGIFAAAVVLFLRLGDNALPAWFYKLAGFLGRRWWEW
jgi:hypothetical protein